MKGAIKRIGKSGQVSLGKEFAGRDVLVEEIETGVWLIKAGSFIPDNERWLHAPEAAAKLDRAVAWAESNPPRETDLDDLGAKLGGERHDGPGAA